VSDRAARPSAALFGIRDLDGDAVAAWRELAATALEPNPFFHPDMALAAARHLPGGENDRLLAVFGDGGALRFALPVRRTAWYRRVPVPAYRAWGHTQSFLDTPLVDPDDPLGAWAGALGALRAAGADWLVLERLPGDGPVRAALDEWLADSASRPRILVEYERPVLRRRPEPDYLDGRLSTQRRKRLRRQRRHLEAALGGPLTVHDNAQTDMAVALDRFLELEGAGWKGKAGTALASRPAEAAVFREAVTAFARRGCAQLWELGPPDAPVASLCAVVASDGVFHLKIAHDERYAAESPGLQLELELIAEFHRDTRLGWIDSCTSAGPSPSALLYPDRRPIQSVVLPIGGIRARASARALQRGLHGRDRARAAVSIRIQDVKRASRAVSARRGRRTGA
jgi:hypothetical protein